MKLKNEPISKKDVLVASLAEAWIEILSKIISFWWRSVASLAEAWIEINTFVTPPELQKSPPSRRRGLKSEEMGGKEGSRRRRLPRGGVD